MKIFISYNSAIEEVISLLQNLRKSLELNEIFIVQRSTDNNIFVVWLISTTPLIILFV